MSRQEMKRLRELALCALIVLLFTSATAVAQWLSLLWSAKKHSVNRDSIFLHAVIFSSRYSLCRPPRIDVTTTRQSFGMQCRWACSSAFGELGSGVPGPRLE